MFLSLSGHLCCFISFQATDNARKDALYEESAARRMNETSLPSFALRLRGSRVLQSLTVQEEPETYGLLPPRSSFGSPGTLGSLTPGSPYRFFSKQ
jgi:hypothetical protein